MDGEERYVLSPTWLRRHPIYSLNYIVVRGKFVLYQSQLIIISLRGWELRYPISWEHHYDGWLWFDPIRLYRTNRRPIKGVDSQSQVQTFLQCWPRWAIWLWWVSSLLSFWPLSTFWSTKRFPGLFLCTINSHYTLPSVAATALIRATASKVAKQNIGEILTKPMVYSKKFWNQKYVSL